MRIVAVLAALAASPAHADLYRWVDPQTGSIKYSNHAPPWLGDHEREARAPAVEVIRYEQARAAPPPPDKPAAKPRAAAGSLSVLENQFATILQLFQSMRTRGDFDRAGAAFREQVEMYRAVSAELDRQDPAGAPRRRAAAEQAGIVEPLRQGLEAQLQR